MYGKGIVNEIELQLKDNIKVKILISDMNWMLFRST